MPFQAVLQKYNFQEILYVLYYNVSNLEQYVREWDMQSFSDLRLKSTAMLIIMHLIMGFGMDSSGLIL